MTTAMDYGAAPDTMRDDTLTRSFSTVCGPRSWNSRFAHYVFASPD
jgi:hypothetical protein